MSYTVLHLEKAKGNDAAMSAHIERTVHPKNADKARTYLNKELILYPKGVKNRTAAIGYRIDNAEIKRKIGINQVRAIRVLLSGTHETIKSIEKSGKLDYWCEDNLNWLKETFGEDNLVSAVLHMDEKTPHIHATIVPIVRGERRKSKKENNTLEKYKKKDPNINRLCADDVMARNKLKHYQNTYAVAMQKYGLKRGIEGSEAKHISTSEYYRDLYSKNELLNKEYAKQQLELKELEKDISSKKIISNFANVLTGSKTKKLERENEHIKKELDAITTTKENEKGRLQESILKLENTLENQKKAFDKLLKYHPEIGDSMPIITECEKLGFNQDLIRLLLEKKEIYIKGEIYSSRHFKSFSVDNLKLSIEYNNKEKAKVLKIEGLSSQDWLNEKYKESLRLKSQNNDHILKSDMKNQR
ncbi:plasmid recombination protein [Elizabethkingia anophelis]|uniref:MobV family relaxase n=1 Tax=Elizabethkingia meningoseptica TaxID=238 RepID=UPI0021A3F206|nr:MobV family relaxase [Elizabethkingia meningoseptica]MCT3991080.1 plasmid recombination protein [Elizabethkingia anophelis]EJK5329458.1 plasmid recombination protein [Elizabethkingia meningoseptica]MCT4008882.1 plasmid recombination protein [Elizabethkingia anophelis]MCT4315846.1 plasmid recombination protein [Elizabethkingia anophelis]WBS75861.1 plasmid recombination protein [Elizabethkingia meningoseptica]